MSADGNAFPPYSTKPYFFNITPRAGSPTYKTFEGGHKEYRNFMATNTSTQVDLNFLRSICYLTLHKDQTPTLCYYLLC
jgi:hypothetical protein